MYWILAILMFGIVIMLHEWGHFVAARLTGVKVVEFAVGFGPKLLSHKAKSGVTYSLRALPLGGFCRFLDEDDPIEDAEEVVEALVQESDGMEVAQVADPPVNPDALAKQKIWKRALISFSGPLMNFITAIILLFVLFFAVGLQVGVEPAIGNLLADMPAEAAGMLPGDRIAAINGTEITSAADASALISEAGDSLIIFTMERDGELLDISLRPQLVAQEDGTSRYMIGIEYRVGTERVRLTLGESIQNAFIITGDMARLIVDALRDLIVSQEGMENLTGPIGTVTVIKEGTEQGGFANYLYMAAAISVNLGLFNLLPVPGLDGSKLLFLLLEKIRGKPMNRNHEGLVTLIGFALLMALMVLVMYQDIARLIK